MSAEPLDPQRIVPVNKFDDAALDNLRRADKAFRAQAGTSDRGEEIVFVARKPHV